MSRLKLSLTINCLALILISCLGPDVALAQSSTGTLGGPVNLPGALSTSKSATFFFLSYEGLRQHKGITGSTVVLTEQERRGKLSNVSTPIIDPLTNQP